MGCVECHRFVRLIKFDFVVEILRVKVCSFLTLLRYLTDLSTNRLYAPDNSLRLSILNTNVHFNKCRGATRPSQSANIWGVHTSSSLPKWCRRYTEVEQGSDNIMYC